MNQTESNQKILELMNQDKFFSKEEIQLFKELMFQCDLNIQNKYGHTPLMYALRYNQSENLNLSKEQWDYLIKNSDLNIQNKYGDIPLMYALENNKEQSLKLSSKQFQTMYASLEEEQKQNTFQNIIQENFENNQQYIKEINLFLYDFQFKPHEKTLHWLKENNYQDIVQRIEKRDLFFQLNKNFKEIDKKEKIATIKI